MILPYLTHILILIGIYTILVISLNIVLGYSGLLNLGQIALFGIGAYTSALLSLNGFSFVASFVLAGLVAGIFGFILAFVTQKLKGDYFTIASLGFAFVVYSLLLNLNFLTRGPLGLAGITRPNLFGFFLNSNYLFLLSVSVVATSSYAFIRIVTKSRFGKTLEAMRDDELRLKTLGVDTRKLKYKVMTLSGLFAGIAGSLFAHYISFIEPSSFYIGELIFILTILIIGGIASLKGSVIATFLIIGLSELLRFINLPSSVVGPARQIIYALVLIIILIYKPRGLFGKIDLD